MLRLVVDNGERGQESKPDETKDADSCKQPASGIEQTIQTNAEIRTSIVSGDVYKAIKGLYKDVLDGRIKTFRQVAAILKLQRISFPEPEGKEKRKNDIIDTALRELRYLVTAVEEGIPAELSEIHKILVNIDYAPADSSTLPYLDSLEAENRDKPFFEQLKREVRAIRLIKKDELIHNFRSRLRRIANGKVPAKTPDEIYQFQNEFFGDDTTPGCGLTIDDLRPSPKERMLLIRLGGKGIGIHQVRDALISS